MLWRAEQPSPISCPVALLGECSCFTRRLVSAPTLHIYLIINNKGNHKRGIHTRYNALFYNHRRIGDIFLGVRVRFKPDYVYPFAYKQTPTPKGRYLPANHKQIPTNNLIPEKSRRGDFVRHLPQGHLDLIVHVGNLEPVDQALLQYGTDLGVMTGVGIA